MGNNDLTPDKEVSIDKYDYLKKMDTAKLQTLLQNESYLTDDTSFDFELVQNIVAILDERDPTPIKIDAEASYSTFMDGIDASVTNYSEDIAKNTGVGDKHISQTPNLKRSRRSIKFLLAAVIIMTLLGCTVIAGAFGFNLWEYVINWGKETFQIGDSADISGDTNSDSSAEISPSSQYSSPEDAAKEINQKILMLDWIPDDFGFVNAEVSKTAQKESMVLLYQRNTDVLMYNVTAYDQSDATYSYEKESDGGETIVINGIECYFMPNIDQNQVVWVSENCVYSINGNVTKEELIKMVKSIYEGD